MTKRIFLIGIVGGLAGTLCLAVLFSTFATHSSAQMMPQQGMMMQHSQMPGSVRQHSMFNANGMSMVQEVRITGVTITGDNEVSVNLTYIGNASAPSVTLIALTNHEQMMGSMMMGSSSSMGGMGRMMMGGQNIGMMYGQSMTGSSMPQGWDNPDMPRWNATQWQQWHSQMSALQTHQYAQVQQSQSGSAVLAGGWQSGSPVIVSLDGNRASAYDASDLLVVVFPHLS